MSARFSANTNVLTATTGLPSTIHTVTCWAYLVASRTSTYYALCDLPATTGASAATWQYPGMNPTFGWVFAQSPSTETTPITGAVGAWYKIAYVHTSATSVTMYAATEAAALTSQTATVTSVTPAKLYVGGDSYPGEFWGGRIGAFKMWNAALTLTEINAELAQFQPVRTLNLLRSHTFKTDILDTSGNNNQLTAGSAAVTFEADPPIPDGGLTVVKSRPRNRARFRASLW